MRQRRHTLSINGALYKRLAARCAELGVSVSGTVERLLAGDLASVTVPPSQDRGRKFVSDPPRVTKGRLAAQLAHDEKLSFVEAARRTGVNRATIAAHWQRLYPDEPKKPGRPSDDRYDRAIVRPTAAQVFARTERAVHRAATCAYCVSRLSTHTDDEGFACCDRCESEPAIERRGVERGYEPSGGLPTHDEGARACRNDPAYQRAARLDDEWSRTPGEPSAVIADLPRRRA